MERNLIKLNKVEQLEFLSFFLERDKKLYSLVILFTSVQYAIFLPIEIFRGFTDDVIIKFRIGGAVFYLVLFLITKGITLSVKSYQWYSFFTVILTLVFCMLQDYFADGHPLFLSNTMLILVLFIFIASGMFFNRAIVSTILAFVIYLSYVNLNTKTSEILIKQFPSLISTTAFIVFSGYLLQQYKYAYYCNIKQLDLEKEKYKELSRFKDRLFTVLAHDFRSPLKLIKKVLDLLSNKIVNPNELEIMIPELKKKLSHAAIVASQLLEKAENQMSEVALKPTWFLIDDLLNDVKELYVEVAEERKIQIEYLGSDKILKAYADINMINTVIRNLISHSLEFCSMGDKIEFRTFIKNERFIVIHLKSTTTTGKSNFLCSGIEENPVILLCKDFIEKNNGEFFIDKTNSERCNIMITLPGMRSKGSKYIPPQFSRSETLNSNDL